MASFVPFLSPADSARPAAAQPTSSSQDRRDQDAWNAAMESERARSNDNAVRQKDAQAAERADRSQAADDAVKTTSDASTKSAEPSETRSATTAEAPKVDRATGEAEDAVITKIANGEAEAPAPVIRTERPAIAVLHGNTGTLGQETAQTVTLAQPTAEQALAQRPVLAEGADEAAAIAATKTKSAQAPLTAENAQTAPKISAGETVAQNAEVSARSASATAQNSALPTTAAADAAKTARPTTEKSGEARLTLTDMAEKLAAGETKSAPGQATGAAAAKLAEAQAIARTTTQVPTGATVQQTTTEDSAPLTASTAAEPKVETATKTSAELAPSLALKDLADAKAAVKHLAGQAVNKPSGDASPMAELMTSRGADPMGATLTARPPAAVQAASVPMMVEPQRQIADAIRVRSNDQSISLRLDPPDLGSVKIDLNFDKSRLVTATVSAEQLDTQGLLRRNLDQLQRDLADAGFEGVQIDFTSHDTTGDSGSSNERLLAFQTPAYERTVEAQTVPTRRTQIITADRIDARF
ncbi:flagellar hook-length control protein FliK [Parvularcula sp. LCG005]|uniref:flagellar hook-length control protein FliK n=1 Tax=Parvularcula sp. LCG005 TaxID=3078805 RepID=UPI002943CAD2|nr:flagellar hook-length control protein FliK [Parvularcula sp. LCG005]WOI52685.1 flagellar hook-length control protein FliK [Parvularcula sp. LCG005]